MKNNDRFKYRIWENRCKQFIYDGCINVRTGNFAVGNLLYEKHLIKEQCTGLKDNKGKLIYEGDIVRKDSKQDFEGDSTTPSYYCDCSCIGIVAFNASTGYFMKNAKVFLTLNKNEPKKLQDKILKRTRLCAKRCTVIGNIHEDSHLLENPELLRSAK